MKSHRLRWLFLCVVFSAYTTQVIDLNNELERVKGSA